MLAMCALAPFVFKWAADNVDVAVRALRRAPSPVEVEGYLRSERRRKGLFDSINGAVRVLSTLPVSDQRAGAAKFVALCAAWVSKHQGRGSYEFDCGKLDFLAKARGEESGLNRFGARDYIYFACRSKDRRGVELYGKDFPGSTSGPGIHFMSDPADFDEARRLIASGYYDLPCRYWKTDPEKRRPSEASGHDHKVLHR